MFIEVHRGAQYITALQWIHKIPSGVGGTLKENRSCLPLVWSRKKLGTRSGSTCFRWLACSCSFTSNTPSFSLVSHVCSYYHPRSRASLASRSHPLSQTCFRSCVGGFLREEVPATLTASLCARYTAHGARTEENTRSTERESKYADRSETGPGKETGIDAHGTRRDYLTGRDMYHA